MIVLLPDREIPIGQGYSAFRAGQHKNLQKPLAFVAWFLEANLWTDPPFPSSALARRSEAKIPFAGLSRVEGGDPFHWAVSPDQ
jgi:hypothetical protein